MKVKKESDHNILFLSMNLKKTKKGVNSDRIEIFNFNDENGKLKFKQMTSVNNCLKYFLLKKILFHREINGLKNCKIV